MDPELENEDGPSAVDLLNDDIDPSPEPPVAAQPPTPAFDPKAFAEQFGASFASAVAPHVGAAAQPKPQLTPEEAKKLLNVWEPDDAFVQEFGNLETQKPAFAKLRDAIIRQADTINQMRLQEVREELEKKYSPLREYYERAQSQAMEERLYKAHAGLNTEALTPLRNAVIQQLQAEGKTFPDEKALFTEIANRVESVAKQFNPAFTLAGATAAPAATKTKSTAAASGTIPVTSPGAGGGGGTGGGKGGGESSGKPRALNFL